MLQADPVGHFHHPLSLCLGVVVLPTIPEAYGIETEVIVQMVFIQMGGDDNLESVAPQFLCGLYTNLVAQLRCDFARFEALVSMPSDVAIVLAKLLLGEFFFKRASLILAPNTD